MSKHPGKKGKGELQQTFEAWAATDKALARWRSELARGSPVTAQEYARVLTRYLHQHDLTPQQLVRIAKKDPQAVENQLHDFIADIEKRTQSGGYIRNHLKTVKSWLAFNHIYIQHKFKLKNAEGAPTLEDERVPTKEELAAVLRRASLRGRTIISLMAFGGLRPEALGNHDGSDGLRLQDLPELEVSDRGAKFTKIPARVVIRSTISKAKNAYFTFIGKEGAEHVAAYMSERALRGEKLGPSSPLVRKEWRGKDDATLFIRPINIGGEVRRYLWPTHQARPYVLRAFFSTRMAQAEADGKITRLYREFLMGHKQGVEGRYTMQKKLPESVIEDVRRRYADCQPYVETAPPPTDFKAQMIEILKAARRRENEEAKRYGIDPLELEVQKAKPGAKLDQEREILQLFRELAQPAGLARAKPGTTFVNGGGRTNRVVKGDKQLVKFLNDGWELVQSLAGDKFLVRQPS